MTEPKLCQDCKWSKPEENGRWENRCYHPSVISRDAWALACNCDDNKRGRGVNCREERGKGIMSSCGMRGALWEPKPNAEVKP